MISTRLLKHFFVTLLFCLSAFGSVAWGQVLGGGGWRPYRPRVSQPLPSEAPAWQSPVEFAPPGAPLSGAISDTQLDQMRMECYEQPCLPSYAESPYLVGGTVVDSSVNLSSQNEAWAWHVLPADVIWHSYWAGANEPRISGTAFADTNGDVSLQDVTLGGRASILRYGTVGEGPPEGWELQIEGASMMRLNLDEHLDLEAVDFRFGVPIVYGRDKWQGKLAYYHLSSHLGDEYIIRTGNLSERINFSRDVLVLGFSYFPRPAWRWYAETGWAFHTDEGTEPWEFQFGLDYAQPGPTGFQGTPFLAINGHLREEVDFGGNFVAQGGWLWRGNRRHTMRMGVHYHNGKSNQFEFFDEFEQQFGVGLWYDH